MVIKFFWRLISTWLDSRMRLVTISSCSSHAFPSCQIVTSLFLPPLPDSSPREYKTEKVVLLLLLINRAARRNERKMTSDTSLDNEPGTCQMHSLDISYTNTTHRQRQSCYSFYFLDVRPVVYRFSRLLSHIRSVRFDERSYWSLTTPVGSWSDIYIFFLYYLFKKKNIYTSILLMRLLSTSKKKKKVRIFSFLSSFQFFFFFSLGALLWSGTPPSAPSRYHLSTLFWNQYII